MELKVGDWVRTDDEEIGRIDFIDRATAFVDFGSSGQKQEFKSFSHEFAFQTRERNCTLED